MDSNRKTAYLTLLDIETQKAYSNIALNHKIAVNRPESPAFVREIVYGVLENRINIDYCLDRLLKSGVTSIRPQELTILRMGVYQLSRMDSVPPYAAINESVNLAKRYCKSRASLINGVLRNFQRKAETIEMPEREKDEIEFLSVKYSYAPWIVRLWMEHYGAEKTEKMLRAGNERPPLTVRCNELKASREELKAGLIEQGYDVSDGVICERALNVRGGALLDTDMFRLGLFSPQDESSMLVSEKIGVRRDELIMDVCAAPGGKTMAIAERMENTGKVIASDIYTGKLEIIDREAKRLGLTNIETKAWDATRVNMEMVRRADRVLVDAPCSGLGVVRRKPEIKYKEKDRDMESLPEKQLAILAASSMYVKPGGTLVYSTCTVNPEENENTVNRFLENNRNFDKVEEILLLPDVNETDGFFICVMKENNK